ncbi:hypothetical protein D3C87_377660 [compost metagenome]
MVLMVAGKLVIKPQLEKWALENLKKYSAENLPVDITAESLDLTFFRPSASLMKILVTPKGDLTKVTEGISIESISVNLNLFDLISGKLNLSSLVVDSLAARINIDPLMESDTPPSEIPMDLIFEWADKIPLQRVFLQNINISVESKKLKFAVETQNGGILLSNMGKNITGKIDIPSLYAQLEDVGDFTGAFDTHLYLTRQSLRIIQLGMKLDDSEVVARGELTNFKDVMIKPTGVIDISAKININDIYNELKRIKPQMKIPVLAGSLSTDVDIRFNGVKELTGHAEITTEKIVVDNFQLGDAKIEGDFKNRTISFSEVEVNHPAGKAKLNGSQITLDKSFEFRSTVKVESLDLQKLFLSMDLKNIPTGVDLQGTLPCRGQALDGFFVTCENAVLSGKKLWVHSENKPNAASILDLDALAARGNVSVNADQVSYSAQVNIGTSEGTSDGVIKFAEGFKINFATKKLEFKDVRNLANLKFVGSASIEGSTQGDSGAAIFDMKLNGRNFVFEDFNLGNVITDLKYRGGRLIFEDLAGALNKTQYLGELEVDLNKDRISGELSLPTADLGDVAKIFENLYRFPLELSAKGAAKAQFSGPFSFWKMSYNLQSQFKNISAGPETFDLLTFNVTSNGKEIKPQKVVLQKNDSTVNVTGTITSDQDLALLADGKNWRLEESSAIAEFNSTMVGNLNFSSELKGKIASPHILVKGGLTDTIFEDQEIPNSNFIMTMDRQSLTGQVSLFGDKVQGEFQVPFSKGSSPLSIKMNTREWNYSALLAIIGGANLATEYESSLTSSIDLKSDTGDLFKSTGRISIPQFYLKRGNLMFRNKKTAEIVMENGLTSIRNFELDGQGTNIQIKGTNFTTENLNVDVNARIDLRLMQIFLPFLEDLGGPLLLSTSVSGKLTKPEILGNATLNNAYLRIKGFPHPIERLQGDVVFSHTKILVNSLRAQLAGGTLSGDGGIMIHGIRNLPTSIRLRLENVSLNVPDKVRSNGNADLLFSGNWFPFTLSGSYNIQSALIEKEFTEDSGTIAGVRQSVYLPKALKESRFEPIILDLQLLMERNIVVKNSMIDGSVSGNLQVKGTPSAPVLLGRITTDKKTKLLFKDKIFDVINGVVQFSDPYELNPDLFVTATSRVNDYDITLLAQGSAKNPTIRLTSLPPLSEQDIISLIALGVTSSAQQNIQSKNQAEQTGFEIGAATLAKPLSKQLQSTLGLDLQFSSQFDATRNISVPKVTLSRGISEKLKVSGSRAVGDDPTYDIKLEYQLNNNLTAVGSFESRGVQDNASLQGTAPDSQSIFGLDLEFKREFK